MMQSLNRFLGERAAAAIAPYAVWMALMWVLPSTAAGYAIRTFATLAALCAAAPFLWRRRGGDDTAAGAVHALSPRDALVGVAVGTVVGVAVTVAWIAPEYSAFYREWFVIGPAPDPAEPYVSEYAPGQCGWTLTVIRIFGSAFVIAPVEELFFRSYLYRRLQGVEWRSESLRRFDMGAFAWMCALFALEHNRPLAAVMAGAAYGWVFIRCGFAGAAIAHIVTNLLLGVYVVAFDAWIFW